MSFKLLNRCRMSMIGAPGTGTITVNSAAVGFQSFSAAGLADGDSTSYVIEDGNPLGSAWEIGVGTWHANGTFTRDTVSKSSAGGTTKISVTASAIINSCVRAEDLMAAPPISGATSAPSVVQYTTFGAGSGSLWQAVFPSNVTPGNLILFIGNAGDTSGSAGFNVPNADFQHGQNNTTAWSVGWSWRVARSTDLTTFTVGNSSGVVNGIALEISGATIAAIDGTMWTNGTLGGSATNVDAVAPQNSLEVVLAACSTSNTVSVTLPASLQVSSAYLKAGWQTTGTATTNRLTGSSASANGAFSISIPGH